MTRECESRFEVNDYESWIKKIIKFGAKNNR